MNIAIIGAGVIGQAIAFKLLKDGCEILLFNRKGKDSLSKGGVTITVENDIKKVLLKSSAVLVALRDYDAICSVFSGLHDNLTGKKIVMMSTLSPNESKNLYYFFNEKNACYVECPFMGSKPDIEIGELSIIASGDMHDIHCVQHIIGRLGNITFAGPIGKASAIKLAFNNILASSIVSFSQSIKFIESENVSIDTFMDAIRSTAIYCKTYDKKINKMITGDYQDTNFSTDNLLKDVSLFIPESVI